MKHTAGRELDALIAEKVMGTDRLEGMFVQKVSKDSGTVTIGTEWHYPPYSTSIEAAWQVVEKLKLLGFIVGIDENTPPHPDLSCCVIGRPEKASILILAEGLAGTAPLAICLAALEAEENK